MKFPDLVHAVKPEPHHAMPQAASAHDTFWDFVSLMPESTHMLMWVMSDRAIPRSYRMMQGFGVHTLPARQRRRRIGVREVPLAPAAGHAFARVGRGGEDRRRRSRLPSPRSVGSDRGRRLSRVGARLADLHRGAGRRLQLRHPRRDEDHSRGAGARCDAVGRMVLNRNPDNFFAETEQVAFCTAHVVPGIDFSNDPLLAGRIHSYVDTQITRLGGPNFHEIPINAPIAPVHNNQRDGLHRQAIARGRVAYEPNSLGGGCPFQAGARGLRVVSASRSSRTRCAASRRSSPITTRRRRCSTTARPTVEKAHIVGGVPLRAEQGARCRRFASAWSPSLRNVDEELAPQVADGLGIELPEPLPRARRARAARSRRNRRRCRSRRVPATVGIRTRKVAILVADGVDATHRARCRRAARSGCGRSLGRSRASARLRPRTGETMEADASMENEPGFLFDGLVLPDGAGRTLAADGHDAEFVKDQYRHGKTMLASAKRARLFKKAGIDRGRSRRVDDVGRRSPRRSVEFMAALASTVTRSGRPIRRSSSALPNVARA